MPRISKREQRLKTYGNVQQTVPVLMSDIRYDAFKRLVQGSGNHINKILRDLIEEAYGEALDETEMRISLESDQQESSYTSKDAERLTG